MKRIVLVLAAGILALTSCGGQKEVVKKNIGVQLYSIRNVIGNADLYAQNHEEAFKSLAEMGYNSVEAACYSDGKLYGIAPEQYKADLEAAGLKSISTHIMKGLSQEELESGIFTESMKWWDQAIAAHKAAGCEYIVCPGFSIPGDLKGLKVYCDYFNAIGKKCAENGIKFGYHNHSHEFNKIEDKVIYDFMLENTDPQYVFFEMDVYWAVMGRVSPVNYFKNNPGRFKLLHIKDYRELGQSGMVGFDAIFNNAAIAGVENIVVEIEAFTNGDWKESLKMCADYLLNSDFVKPAYPVAAE
jgi:Sugar phosphate isomerases/epimerases